MKRLPVALLLAAITSGAAYAQVMPVPRPERGIMVFTDNDGGYLGVQTVNITGDNAMKYGLKEARGVAVEKVMEDSPASAAGLQNGDVIIRFDGEEIKSAAKLTRLISEVAPDQKARVTVLRSGGEREIVVTIGKRPEQTNFRQFGSINAVPPTGDFPQSQEFKLNDDLFKNLPKGAFPGENLTFSFNQGRKIGVVAEGLTKQLGEHFGVADGRGLLVSEVRPDSPAGKAGLKAGDIIVQIDGTAVANSDELVKAVNVKKEGEVEVTFIRDKERRTVRLTPEQAKSSDLPTIFQTVPGSYGERRTIIIPRTVETPSSPLVPANPPVVRRIN
jgi:serine protease Do